LLKEILASPLFFYHEERQKHEGFLEGKLAGRPGNCGGRITKPAGGLPHACLPEEQPALFAGIATKDL
jgi:hypothetical protein